MSPTRCRRLCNVPVFLRSGGFLQYNGNKWILISDCVISNCTAFSHGGARGGTFSRCLFLNNKVTKAYGETGDYEQAITNMNNDIISGKMPDILVVESNQDISSWVNKGLLADIEALNAEDTSALRRKCFENDIEIVVVKNTLLKKALEQNLRPILFINKIDRKDARPQEVVDMTFELFMELNATDEQLDFPIIYGTARDGIAKLSLDEESNSVEPLLETILKQLKILKLQVLFHHL